MEEKDELTQRKNILNFIDEKKDNEIICLFKDFHPADISEILNELSKKEALYVFNLLDRNKVGKVFTELENDDLKKEILKELTSKDIAKDLLEELDSDDATDIISEMSDKQKIDVIRNIEDKEQAKDIVDLLRYDEDTAGAIMAKEYIAVNENMNIFSCIREIRKQAEEIGQIHKVFVIDDDDKLKGFLSLKKLLTISTKTPIKEIYANNIISVKVDDSPDNVSNVMKKYNLFVVPVVDEIDRLIGVITLDDIVDIITEEAEKDYQLASGLSSEIEYKTGIFQNTKARIPWLFIGLVGGVFSGQIIKSFEGMISTNLQLVMFIPLIAAMGGNVGVQSSAIVVQGLANKSIEKNILSRLWKEALTSILNGILLSFIIILVGYFFGIVHMVNITVSISLIIVMINASIIGSFIPFLLDKFNINPAIATGPFITTTNDILGVFLYFLISKFMLGL